jgi:tubulin beta
VKWIPHNVKTSVVDVPHNGFTRSATMLCNTTAIVGMFERIQENFEVMFKKRAFLHWYKACGMEEQEFTEAKANMVDVAEGYRDAKDDDEAQE